jgi:hypothetical protein
LQCNSRNKTAAGVHLFSALKVTSHLVLVCFIEKLVNANANQYIQDLNMFMNINIV